MYFLLLVVTAVVSTVDGDGAVCMGSRGDFRYGVFGFEGGRSGMEVVVMVVTVPVRVTIAFVF